MVFGEDTKTFKAGEPELRYLASGRQQRRPRDYHAGESQKGDSYFEKNAPGVAVDQAAVTSVKASASVPFGTFDKDCLQTQNSSALFPGDIEFKVSMHQELAVSWSLMLTARARSSSHLATAAPHSCKRWGALVGSPVLTLQRTHTKRRMQTSQTFSPLLIMAIRSE